MKRTEIIRHVRKTAVFSMACALLLLSGCQGPFINWVPGQKVDLYSGYDIMTDPGIRLIALEYRNEFSDYYEELLGADFWQTQVQDGINFETYVKEDYVYQECEALLTLKYAASCRNIKLTQSEKEEMKVFAESYYEALSPDDLSYTGASLSSVENLMCDYLLAEKTIDDLTGNVVIEVSDEESRVADIQVIELQDAENAELARARLENGENFLSVAKDLSLDKTISYSVCKEDLIDELRKPVFSLSEGDYTDVIFANGLYFIVRVSQYYNTLLSRNQKMNLLAERKFEAWQENSRPYADKITIRRNSDAWDKIRLNVEGDFSGTSLFDAFE